MREVLPDLSYLQTLIVNVYFVGRRGAGDRHWTLVDAGMPGCAGAIAAAARHRFGAASRPAAIVLTHGHFDHVGGLRELAERWEAPIYAHRTELPYVTGRSAYPPPDPSVGGGAMAWIARLYPRGPVDAGERAHALPEDGTVPGMPGWRWLATPGHTAGHVSLYRDADRTLIAGDAFTTVKQESMLAVLTQHQRVHGPPAYYTADWQAARRSVEALAALQPEVGATGHGVPMEGELLRRELSELAARFEELAMPKDGRYVREPAVADETGVVSVPPARPATVPTAAVAVVGLAALGAGAVYLMRRQVARAERRDAQRSAERRGGGAKSEEREATRV